MNRRAPSFIIGLEKLLYPISVEHPAGESLRYEGTYDRIQEARREDDPNLEQGIYKTDVKKADWSAVERICLDALETRSKDLQIAVWLLEAWLHLHGFAGVKEGLNVLISLCEGFWNDLYPKIDEGSFEFRVAPVEWMNEKLSLKLRQIPITQPQTADVPLCSYVDWESACRLEHKARRDAKAMKLAESTGKITLAKFQTSVMLTPKHFYEVLTEDLSSAIEVSVALERFFDERCGRQSPSLFQFIDALEAIYRLVSEILRQREGEEPAVSEEEETMYAQAEEQEEIAWGGAPIRSRAEAYRRLAEAAEYLLRTEPHSPTPYLVKRAVAWGSMSLYELLRQIIRNDSELQELNRLLRLQDDDLSR